MTKDPSYFRKDRRVEHIIAKYREFLKSNDNEFIESSRGSTQLLDSSYKEEDQAKDQVMFIKEVLYNYLDKELGKRRQD